MGQTLSQAQAQAETVETVRNCQSWLSCAFPRCFREGVGPPGTPGGSAGGGGSLALMLAQRSTLSAVASTR